MLSGIGSHMPIRKTYWYSTSDCETRFQLAGVMRPLRDVAVDAADDYHGNHDGWESRWPLDFFIYESEEGLAVARFEVERETVPQFYAWERALSETRTPTGDPSHAGKPAEGDAPP